MTAARQRQRTLASSPGRPAVLQHYAVLPPRNEGALFWNVPSVPGGGAVGPPVVRVDKGTGKGGGVIDCVFIRGNLH